MAAASIPEANTPNITTTAQIESGDTVVQTVSPSGEVTQTSTPAPKAPDGTLAVLDTVEAEVVSTATADLNTVESVVQTASVDGTAAFNDAKSHANTLFMLLHNAAGHLSLDLEAVDKVMADLGHSLSQLFQKL